MSSDNLATSNAHETMSSFNGKPKATVFRYVRSRLRLAVKRWLANCGSYFVSAATGCFRWQGPSKRLGRWVPPAESSFASASKPTSLPLRQTLARGPLASGRHVYRDGREKNARGWNATSLRPGDVRVRGLSANRMWVFALFACACGLAMDGRIGAQEADTDPDFRGAIEADWAAQERRAGRRPGSVEALQATLDRTERLRANSSAMPDPPDIQSECDRLGHVREKMDGADRLNDSERLALYHELRWLTRAMALKNPLLAGRPVAFLKRRRFICQMLHEYIGYYYNYADLAGGGVFVLDEPGRSLKVHSPWPLSEDHFLVAFSFDPLPGMGSRVLSDSETGIYNNEALDHEKKQIPRFDFLDTP